MDLLPTDTPLAIEIAGLSKHFGPLTAVDSLNLQVLEGECFGFLGPNGAGKTTTLNMLTTLLKPSAGRVKICGFDLESEVTEIKRHIGLMPDNPTIYQSLTGRQFIYFVASLYGLKKTKIDELAIYYLDLLDILSTFDDPIRSYSFGMQKKILLVSVLVRQPKVLFLDEPTVGLDPKSANTVKKIVRQLCASGRTIFMTSHMLQMVEQVCDRIGIIQNGKLITTGTLTDLRTRSNDISSLEDIFLQLTNGLE